MINFAMQVLSTAFRIFGNRGVVEDGSPDD